MKYSRNIKEIDSLKCQVQQVRKVYVQMIFVHEVQQDLCQVHKLES